MKSIKGGKHPEKEMDEMLQQMADMISRYALKPVPDNSHIQYSELLSGLVQPYRSSESDVEEFGYLLDMGLVAWNLSVYKQKNKFFYETSRKSIFAEAGLDRESRQLIDRLMQDKEKKYNQYDAVLVDFEIDEGPNEVSLSVMAKPFEAFIQEALQEASDDEDMDMDDFDELNGIGEDTEDLYAYDPDDAEMESLPAYVSRSGITLKPKAPFLEWMRKIYFPEEPPIPTDHNIYLVPELNGEEQLTRWLEENFDPIFQNELDDWHEEEEDWPAGRTYDMFVQWFSVEMHTMVYDTDKTDLEKEA